MEHCIQFSLYYCFTDEQEVLPDIRILDDTSVPWRPNRNRAVLYGRIMWLCQGYGRPSKDCKFWGGEGGWHKECRQWLMRAYLCLWYRFMYVWLRVKYKALRFTLRRLSYLYTHLSLKMLHLPINDDIKYDGQVSISSKLTKTRKCPPQKTSIL